MVTARNAVNFSEGAVIVGTVCLAALIIPLSFTAGAVATPAIGREFSGSAAELTWITNAFMLTFGSFLMLAGAFADQYGRKRVFTVGVFLFVAFSLALSFAPSVWVVDLLRAGQGVGAAAALAGGSAAMAQEFSGLARLRAFSFLGTTFGVGLAFGPIIAGVLIDSFGWRSIFVTSTVIGFLSLAFGLPRLRETRDPEAAGIEWFGAITFTLTLTLFTFGIIQAPASGWTSPVVLMLLAASAMCAIAFVVAEARAVRPMLDLTLFRYARFVGVQLLPIATCYSYVVMLIILPLRFIGVDGLAEVDAGILMLALSAPMLVVPALAAVMTRWFSAGAIAGSGLLIAAGGLLLLGQAASQPSMNSVGAMLLMGFGAAMPWGLMDGLSVSVVPKERAGMATGIFNTTKVAGEGVALAIVTAALSGLTELALQHSANATGSSEGIREVAQRLANGDLAHAATLVPESAKSFLAQSYAIAFETLTRALAGITVVSAAVCFWLLRMSAPSVDGVSMH